MTRQFDLTDDDVNWTLYAVYWLQTGWMILAGLMLLLSPKRRFGNAYEFIVAIPAGQVVLGGAYIVAGGALFWALRKGNQARMARGLFVGGLLGVLFGMFLLAGTLSGPTGVVGWLFCFYVGPHMLLQSGLLGNRRRRK